MLKKKIHLAFGTDYDVEPINPMRGLYACVTRELPEGGPAGGWQPQEKISMDECIHAYTSGAAYAEFEEGKKGRLVEGNSRYSVPLPNDATNLPPASLFQVRVIRTIVGGHTVYEAS